MVRKVVSFPALLFSGTVEISCINVKIYFVIHSFRVITIQSNKFSLFIVEDSHKFLDSLIDCDTLFFVYDL